MNRRQAGFSYIELLVVVALSALIITTVRLTGSSENQLQRQAEKILALQNELADSAIFEGRPVAMLFAGSSYWFERKLADQWQAIEQRPFTPRTLPQPLWLAPADGCRAGPLAQPVRVLMLPDGVRSPFELSLCDGQSGIAITGYFTHGVLNAGNQ